jgi:hypothetical protein
MARAATAATAAAATAPQAAPTPVFGSGSTAAPAAPAPPAPASATRKGYKVCPGCSQEVGNATRRCSSCDYAFPIKSKKAVAPAGDPAVAGAAMAQNTQPGIGANTPSAAAASAAVASGFGRERTAPAWESVLDNTPTGCCGARGGMGGSQEACSASQASSTFRSTGATERSGKCLEDAIALDESQQSQLPLYDDEPMPLASDEDGEGGASSDDDDGGDYLARMLARRSARQAGQSGAAASGGAASAAQGGSEHSDTEEDSPVAAQASAASVRGGASSPIHLSDEDGEAAEEARQEGTEGGEMEDEHQEEGVEEQMEEDEQEEEMAAGLGGNTQQYFSTQAYSGGLSEGVDSDDDAEEADVPYVAPDTALYLRVTSLVLPAARPQIFKLDDGPNALQLGRIVPGSRDPRGRFEKQLLDCLPADAKPDDPKLHQAISREMLDVRYADHKRAEVRLAKPSAVNAVHLGDADMPAEAREAIGVEWVPWNAGEKLILSVRSRKVFPDVLKLELLASKDGLPIFAQYVESGAAAEHEQVVATEAAAFEAAERAAAQKAAAEKEAAAEKAAREKAAAEKAAAERAAAERAAAEKAAREKVAAEKAAAEKAAREKVAAERATAEKAAAEKAAREKAAAEKAAAERAAAERAAAEKAAREKVAAEKAAAEKAAREKAAREKAAA